MEGRGRCQLAMSERKGGTGEWLGARWDCQGGAEGARPARSVRAQGRGRGAVGGVLGLPGRGRGGRGVPSRQPAVSERKGGDGEWLGARWKCQGGAEGAGASQVDSPQCQSARAESGSGRAC